MYASLASQIAGGLRPSETETDEEQAERHRCTESAAYFIQTHVQIYDPTPGISRWLPFDLWPAQNEVLDELSVERMLCILKARQLGLSWLVLAYALWLMLFRPAATVLIFSKRDDEAIDLLDFRLKGMHERLPEFLRSRSYTDGKTEWLLTNGSRALAFPTTGGRSYTGTMVIVDEADHIPDLRSLMNNVQPTIDAGGQMVILSTPDKKHPQSLFKKIYHAARQRLNAFKAVFLPWSARPERTAEWYQAQRTAALAEKGSLDDVFQEYPATDTEALSPRSLDKRIAGTWIEGCYQAQEAMTLEGVSWPAAAPSIPGLAIYKTPVFGLEYVIGADPAEGNPSSDASSLHVLERDTGEEVARLSGKFEPSVFAGHIVTLSFYYNKADCLPERNNHGHAVILALNGTGVRVLDGDDGKPGWLSHQTGKVKMYDAGAEAFRLRNTRLHSYSTYVEIASIEAATLRAPDEEPDDEADSYMLALLARSRRSGKTYQSNYLTGEVAGYEKVPSSSVARGQYNSKPAWADDDEGG